MKEFRIFGIFRNLRERLNDLLNLILYLVFFFGATVEIAVIEHVESERIVDIIEPVIRDTAVTLNFGEELPNHFLESRFFKNEKLVNL